MRFAVCLFALPAMFLTVLPVVPAAAQQQPPMPPCSGRVNIVRVSDIKPGMMDTFAQAVSAQRDWYKKTGTSDEILLLHVMDMNTHAWSTTEAITEHKQGGSRPEHDAGYDAFVALFQKSSTIKSQYVTCEEK